MAEVNDAPVATDDDAALADVSLVDTPIAPAAKPADKPSEPATDAPKPAADTTDKPTESATDKPDGKESEPTDPKDQTPADQKPAEGQEPQPDGKQADPAKRAFQDRQRTRQQIAQQIDQNYSPKSEEDLVEDGMAPRDAQVEALRQEIAFRDRRADLAEMNAGMQTDAVSVLNDFPEFNPESPQYDPEFTNQVQQAYMQSSRLQADPNGIVLNAELPLYDYYQQMHNIYDRGNSKGTVQGQADAMEMLSRTENPGGANPGNNSGNDVADMEDRLGDVVIT